MKKETVSALLLGSLLLNIVMVCVFVWFVTFARSAMLRQIAESTDEQIAIQRQILDELASGDPQRISALTNSLHWTVRAESKIPGKIQFGNY